MRFLPVRLVTAVTALMVLGGVVAACSSTTSAASPASSPSSSAGTGAGKLTPLTVGILPVADAGGYFVAESRGFFRQHGLSVKSATITGGAALIPALESGAMNVGFSNLVSVLQAGEQNLGAKCLAGTLRKPPTGHNLSLVVSPKYASQVHSAKDLNGKSIAVNTLGNINQVVADAWMQANGGDWHSVHYTAVAFPDMPAAISKGDVAAAITDEPFTTIALDSGAKLLSAAPYQAFAKSPVFSCWLATSNWISSHRSAAKAFVAALNDSDTYLAAHPGYLRQILPKYTSMSQALAQKIDLSEITTELSVSDLRLWQTQALKYHVLSHPVNLSSLIANLG